MRDEWLISELAKVSRHLSRNTRASRNILSLDLKVEMIWPAVALSRARGTNGTIVLILKFLNESSRETSGPPQYIHLSANK